MSKLRERSAAEQIRGWCVNFTGLMNDQCRAGVEYKSVKVPQGGPDGLHGYPCFLDHDIHNCALQAFMTVEEAEAKAAEQEARIRQYFEEIATDVCPVCHKPFERKQQVGRCVYAEPCGHRMYQGKA